MLILLRDLNHLDCALNAKKEIIGLLNANQFFIRMGPLFRETGGGASPRPPSDKNWGICESGCSSELSGSTSPRLSVQQWSPASEGSAAIDLCAAQNILLLPRESPLHVPTGLFGPITSGTVGLLLGRSSLTSQGCYHTGMLSYWCCWFWLYRRNSNYNVLICSLDS